MKNATDKPVSPDALLHAVERSLGVIEGS